MKSIFDTIWFQVGVIIALAIIVLSPALFFGKVLSPFDQFHTMFEPYASAHDTISVYNHFLKDATTQYLPYKYITWENLRAGNIVYWNSLIFAGYPQYANTMGGHFDILNVLLIFFSDFYAAYHWQIVAHLALAGLGMLVLLRSFRLHSTVVLLFAIAYMLNSMFVITLIHRWMIASFLWAPFILWAMRRAVQTKKIIFIAAASAFFACASMGGNFQTTAFLAVVVVVASIFYYDDNQKPLAWKWKISLPVAIGLFGFLLAAVMWFPSLEFFWQDILDGGARSSGRPPLRIMQRMTLLPLLSSFFIPELIGNVRAFDLLKAAGADLNDCNAFFGFFPIVFYVGAVQFWKRLPKTSLPYLCISFIGLLVPLCTPLDAFLYHRFFIVFILGAIPVAAIFADEFLSASSKSNVYFLKYVEFLKKISLVIIIPLGLGSVLFTGMYYFKKEVLFTKVRTLFLSKVSEISEPKYKIWLEQRSDNMVKNYIVTSPTMALPIVVSVASVVGLVIYSQKKKYGKELFLTILICGSTVHLLYFAFSWLPFTDPKQFEPYPEIPEFQAIKNDNYSRIAILASNEAINHQATFFSNTLMMNMLPILGGYESIRPLSFATLLQYNPEDTHNLIQSPIFWHH